MWVLNTQENKNSKKRKGSIGFYASPIKISTHKDEENTSKTKRKVSGNELFQKKTNKQN